jgi:tRNA pseudouridine38-40 synthase
MERYKVTLAYDGTQFFGFQRQGRDRTVQLEVETALRKLNWQGKAVLSAGRTDTGVHASGQVIAFDLEWNHGEQALARAINANLPEDISVQAAEIAPAEFHPRFDAISRSYEYTIVYSPLRNPLKDRYAWRIWPPCEEEKLQEAADRLVGTRDFAAFGTPPRPGGSTIRMVFQAFWRKNGEGSLIFEVMANAFLYHMVRRMVYVQVLFGQGRLSLAELQSGIDAASSMTPGLAPPQGLVLKEVRYGSPNVRMG